MDCKHPLVLGVEGDLKNLLVGRAALRRAHGLLAAVHLGAGAHDGHLRGRARPPVLSVFHLAVGPVVQDAAEGDAGEALGRGGGEEVLALLADHHLQPLRGDARGPLRPRHAEVLDTHLALGEGTRLVGAEDRDAAEGLHGVDLPDQHVPLHHLVGGDHERDRDRRQQPLGHLREERRGAVLQDRRGRPPHGREDVGRQAEQAYADGHDRDDVDKVLDLDLQRRDHSRGLDALRDLAQEGAVPDGMHYASGVPLQHGRAKEGKVPGLCGRRGGRLCASISGLRHGLAREGGVVHLHAVGAGQDAHIRRDAVAGLQEDHVPRHQVHRVQVHLHPLPLLAYPHRGDRGSRLQLLHRLHLRLGLQLRVPLQQRGHDDHGREDNGRDVVGVLLPLRGLLPLFDCSRPAVALGRRLARGAPAGEDDYEQDLSHNAAPEQDVENPAEGLPN
mmetsp:Transcript_38530/g.111299  ORF Transcript_38530/g.111299 Transcript_38530/m.111299 type:complete len:445 (-) Transcript_38530:122-1456(-)